MAAKKHMHTKAKITMSLRLDPELHEAIAAKAHEDERSIHSMIVIMLRAQLKQPATKPASKPKSIESMSTEEILKNARELAASQGDTPEHRKFSQAAALMAKKWGAQIMPYDENGYRLVYTHDEETVEMCVATMNELADFDTKCEALANEPDEECELID
jgi:hypothetical protein